MVADEKRDLVGLLRTLSDDEWQEPSLCHGWRVRDVVAHLLYDTIPARRYLGVVVRNRLSVDRTNNGLVDSERETPAIPSRFRGATLGACGSSPPTSTGRREAAPRYGGPGKRSCSRPSAA